MLTIRQSQIIQVGQQTEEKFIRELKANLQAKQPDAIRPYNPDELTKLLQYLIKWCRNYGVHSTYYVQLFISLYFYYRLTEARIKAPEVIDIFAYPGRREADKLKAFHFLLEHKITVYGQ